MKKIVVRLFNQDQHLIFAIRKEILYSGKEKLTPVVKSSGLFKQWIPIVKVNEAYVAIDLPSDYEYSEEKCNEFINGYRDQLAREKANTITKISYQEII